VGEPLLEPDPETLRVALNTVARQAEDHVRHQNLSVMDRIWGTVGTLLAPALTIMLRIRLKRGRELPDRLRERMGLGGGRRPEGALLWIHAASGIVVNGTENHFSLPSAAIAQGVWFEAVAGEQGWHIPSHEDMARVTFTGLQVHHEAA